MEPKHPNITVRLTGEDSNVFNIIGKVSKALKRSGLRAEAEEFTGKAFKSGSYDEVLQLCMMTVDVT